MASRIVRENSGGEHRALFLVDNSPIHLKKGDDALNLSKMNVGIGGRQPLMEDGYFYNATGEKVA